MPPSIPQRYLDNSPKVRFDLHDRIHPLHFAGQPLMMMDSGLSDVDRLVQAGQPSKETRHLWDNPEEIEVDLS